jgi:predicted lipoprotein
MRRARAELIMMATVLLVSVAVTAARAQEPSPFDHAGLARQALEQHIQPGYAALAAAAERLAKALDGHCARPTEERRRGTERAFDGLVTAWGRIEHIRFGPVTEDNRFERIFFWPDRRGLGGRQVAQTLRARDPEALEASSAPARRRGRPHPGRRRWHRRAVPRRCG